MNYRDKIRKSIECPQFGNSSYGEWGALRIEQRRNIKRLLDELDRADNYIKKLYEEKQELIDYLKEQINTQTKKIESVKSFKSTNHQIALNKKWLCQEILFKIEKR